MTIDDVINAEKLDFITKVYRQGEYTLRRPILVFDDVVTIVLSRTIVSIMLKRGLILVL